jgi:exoribonuclease R
LAPTRFTAVITDVRMNGFFIELVDSMAFGFVATATLVDDHYVLADDDSGAWWAAAGNAGSR